MKLSTEIKKLMFLMSILIFSSSLHASETKTYSLSIRSEGGLMYVVLEDNPTTRDFLSLLPLTLSLNDYGSVEKNSESLSSDLTVEGAPSSAAGKKGDMVYYSPWKNIAFFKGNGQEYRGVVKIGNIVSGEELIEKSGKIVVTIELAK